MGNSSKSLSRFLQRLGGVSSRKNGCGRSSLSLSLPVGMYRGGGGFFSFSSSLFFFLFFPLSPDTLDGLGTLVPETDIGATFRYGSPPKGVCTGKDWDVRSWYVVGLLATLRFSVWWEGAGCVHTHTHQARGKKNDWMMRWHEMCFAATASTTNIP